MPEKDERQQIALDRAMSALDGEFGELAEGQLQLLKTRETGIPRLLPAYRNGRPVVAIEGVMDFAPPVTGYVLGVRFSRVRFPERFGSDKQVIVCASEDSLVPVKPEVAVHREMSDLQTPKGGCGKCRWASWSYAKKYGVGAPLCALQITLLSAISLPNGVKTLGFVRGSRTSFGAISSLIKAVKMCGGVHYRSVPFRLGVITDVHGTNEYAMWTADLRTDDWKEVMASGGYPWTEWFPDEAIKAGLVRLYREYYSERTDDDWCDEWDEPIDADVNPSDIPDDTPF